MKIYNTKPKIEIELENGLHRFYPWSATGKTYLYKQLESLHALGHKIVTYTYDNYLYGHSLKQMVNLVKPEVIMLDRLDMYADDEKIIEVIREVHDKAIVLISKKTPWLIGIDCELIGIEYDKELIKVFS